MNSPKQLHAEDGKVCWCGWLHVKMDRNPIVPVKKFIHENDDTHHIIKEYDEDWRLVRETRIPLKELRG